MLFFTTAPTHEGGFLFDGSADKNVAAFPPASKVLSGQCALLQLKKGWSIMSIPTFLNRPYPANINHLLVKCGTGVLVGESGQLDQNAFNYIARQCVELWTSVTIVSSAGIKAGEESIHGEEPPFAAFFSHKEYAAVGARHLLRKWGDAFAPYRKEIAQIWVTSVNLNDQGERDRIGTAIRFCHRHGVVPIVNENDVVSESWRGMDNDFLAATIAELTHPDAVLFLTRVGGVYEEDPVQNPHARRYYEIDIDAARILATAGSTRSRHGNGGIHQKLLQAIRCVEMGMRVGIAGAEDDNIRRFAAGESVGTMIHQAAHNNQGELS